MSGRRKRGSHRGGLNSKHFGNGMKYRNDGRHSNRFCSFVGSTKERITDDVHMLIFGELPPGPSIESTCEIDKLSDADLSEIFKRLPPYVGSTKERMSDDELPCGPSIQSTLAPTFEIDQLSDADLLEIFKHLPPYARLLVSEVCKRWHGVSRSPWPDVKHLDLSPILGPNIAAVIKQCPNLRDVTATRKTFGINKLHILSRLNLASVKLYNCNVRIKNTTGIVDGLAAAFSDRFRSAAWEELVLEEVQLRPWPEPYCRFFRVYAEFPANFPASLKRLQISHVSFDDDLLIGSPTNKGGLERLNHLEGLLLHDFRWGLCSCQFLPAYVGRISSLKNLKELHISQRNAADGWEKALMSLSMLETLFLFDYRASSGSFDLLATKHPSLRILFLTGSLVEPMDFPARVRYANGFNAPPLPQLHIFVGKTASENIRFPKYPSEAAKVYPITEFLPAFLDRADIKPILEGVWIVGKIKEAAKQSTSWYYTFDLDVATCVRSID